MIIKRLMGVFRGVKEDFGDGSQLRPLDRDTYEYIHSDGRTIRAEAYIPGRGPDDAVIVKGSIAHWWKPYEAEQVPAALQEEILSKLVRYFNKRGVKYRIET